MKSLIKIFFIVISFAFAKAVCAQEIEKPVERILTFEEYLGFVKKHHPLIKQANLLLSTGEANLLRARGAFDPKVELDYDRKKFKGTTYYDELNTTFKIPTWYGVELKGTFEDNTGRFLNPELTVPEEGLYSAGVSFALAQGLLINERMATLKKARFFEQQTKADQKLLVNNIIYDASITYFEWLEAVNEQFIYARFLINAKTRLAAIERSVSEGDKARIDITEARIALQSRVLALEAATLKATKSRLKASTFLWINNIPLEIDAQIQPANPDVNNLNISLLLEGLTDENLLATSHPKIKSLDAKINGLEVDQSLKKNKLLPKINLQYNFLTTTADALDSFNTSNYKAFVDVSFPLFLRKERGDLQLANLKVQDATFERSATSLAITNKIESAQAELNSLSTQEELITNIIEDYITLVNAEERKFFLGESSLFLINSREQKLIEAQLKGNSIEIKSLMAVAQLFNAAGL